MHLRGSMELKCGQNGGGRSGGIVEGRHLDSQAHRLTLLLILASVLLANFLGSSGNLIRGHTFDFPACL